MRKAVWEFLERKVDPVWLGNRTAFYIVVSVKLAMLMLVIKALFVFIIRY